MTGEKDLGKLLRTMKPEHNAGEYVFCPIGEGAVAAVIEGAGARTDVTAALNSDDVVLLFLDFVVFVCRASASSSARQRATTRYGLQMRLYMRHAVSTVKQ